MLIIFYWLTLAATGATFSFSLPGNRIQATGFHIEMKKEIDRLQEHAPYDGKWTSPVSLSLVAYLEICLDHH